MSNHNPEIVLDEADSNRSSQQANPTTKKKSGFQITSVTDSGHGRPASIVRDGEESADDLDESHASYSDISYSRATDVDHDQESTASEDTLNISAHDGAIAVHPDGSGLLNHYSAHHPHLQQPSHVGQTTMHDTFNIPSKQVAQKDVSHDVKKVHELPAVVTTISTDSTLYKQHSEHLESPQELPHDNATGSVVKDKKLVDSDKRVESSQNKATVTSKVSPHDDQNTPEQNSKPSTTVSSNIPVSSQSLQKVSSDTTESSAVPAPITTTVLPTITATTKPVSTPSTVTGVKAPGTRVYKVVKRETAHPVKRMRGRWNWYDFSDTQAPMTGVAQSISETRTTSDVTSIHTFSYTNSLMSPTAVPFSLQPSDSASSLLKQQLYSAGFPSNNSSSSINLEAVLAAKHLKTDGRDVPLMSLGPLRSAMNDYVTRTSGDPSTGDMSVSSRTLKIDNKIEAAMDLVKKHLMSAVRDEVDELKEKIKDLTEETNRLKSENKELRSVLPTDVLSQIQTSVVASKDTPKEAQQNIESSNMITEGAASSSSITAFDHPGQKGMSSSLPQDNTNSTFVGVPRQADGKVKIPAVNMPPTSALHTRQDAIPTATKASIVGQPPNIGSASQAHVSLPSVSQPNIIPKSMQQQPGPSLHQQHAHVASSQQNVAVDHHKSEPSAQMSQENIINPAKTMHDVNFEMKNPS
ncbi:uncharacterized protein LOC120328245 [Styela clava]